MRRNRQCSGLLTFAFLNNPSVFPDERKRIDDNHPKSANPAGNIMGVGIGIGGESPLLPWHLSLFA
jgi:hypothetical protein